MPGLSQISFGTVSSLNPSVPVPTGNADAIVTALGPWTGKPGSSIAVREGIRKTATTGFFSYDEPSCRGAGIAPSITTGLIGAGLGSVPVIGGTLAKVFGIFGAHHANAVKTEQATLCQAVPDANNFLRGIDSAVAQGQIDFATATQALEQGYDSFRAEISGILQDSGGKCNAACVYEKHFRAAVEKRKQDYAIATAQNAAGAQGVAGGVVSAVTSAAGSILSTVKNVVSTFTGSAPASPSSLDAAGLTPARQSSLALFVVVGVGVLSVALFSNFFGGSK